MERKKKRFKCLFKCANLDVLKEVLCKMKTKVLHISSHGIINKENEFYLILEELDKYGKKQIISKNSLESIIIENAKKIKNIDLIVLSNCYSGGLKTIFENISSPKYIIYVNEKYDINDQTCVLFCEHFYSELSEGKSINQSFKNAKIKLKSDSRLFSNQNKEFEIKKLKIFSISNDFLAPYGFNEEGKLIINENVKIHFDSKIYKSMIGRNNIILKVLNDINNDGDNNNNLIIVYGSKSTEKIDFMESLGVYLFEREIIYNYEIYNEYEIDGDILEKIESKIDESKLFVQNLKKKYLIIVQIVEKTKEEINQKLKKIDKINNQLLQYKNFFYFIILIDIEDLSDFQEKEKNICFNSLLEKGYAITLVNQLLKYYGCSKLNKKEENEFLLKAKQIRNENLIKEKKPTKEDDLYEHRTLSKIVDLYFLYHDLSKIHLNLDIMKTKIQLTDIPYLFLLSKMPKGLPDYFLQFIFNKKDFQHDLISKYSKNEWKYINTDIELSRFEIENDGENQVNNNNKPITQEQIEKNSIIYMLKALKLYAKMLYYYIEKDRDKIMYPDENFHFVFNSYNNEGIWKSKIPEIKKKENEEDKINENNFIFNDFNINNHRENIYNLISYLVEKLEYIRIYKEDIDYLVEILLLFPSFFYLKKICQRYIKKCIEFCSKCRDYFKNEKELYNKFKSQNARLSLFLFSISGILKKDENDFKDDKLLILELDFLNFIKKGDKIDNDSIKKFEKSIEDNKELISNEKKSILFYSIGRSYYKLNNFQKSKESLKKALDLSGKFKFLETRIKIDLCHILLNEINSEEKYEINEEGIEDKIKELDMMLNKNFNKELFEEELYLRQEFFNMLKPNIVMLNSNPLNNGYSILSNGIYAYPNNQYYILEKLREIEKNDMNSHIRLKTYILNKQNLIDALKKQPEVLIIQSDDFNENGDIMMESDEGISEKLTIEEFIEIIEDSNFKIVLLSFINSSKLFNSIKDKVNIENYEYLIYVKNIENIDSLSQTKLMQINKDSIKSIIKLISSYNERDRDNSYIKGIDKNIFEIYNSDFRFDKSYLKDNYEYKNKTIISSENNSFLEKRIFFSDQFLELPCIEYKFEDEELYYYRSIMNQKIKAIIKGKGQRFSICKSLGEKYKKIFKKMGFDIMKYFYRHKKFSKIDYYDLDKDGEEKLINKIKNEAKISKNKQNENFYFIYKYNNDDSINKLIDALITNSSYLIINEDDNYFLNEDIQDNKHTLNLFNYTDNGNYSDYDSYSESDSIE